MVVSELRGEKIDIIPYNDEPARFVAKALSPARVREVLVDDDAKQATVVVPDDQLSLAIGREGQNARLAARLTGWRIDIRSDVSVAEAKAAAAKDDDGAEAPPAEAVSAAGADGASAEAAEAATDAVATAPAKPKRASRAKKPVAVEAEAPAVDETPAVAEAPAEAAPEEAAVTEAAPVAEAAPEGEAETAAEEADKEPVGAAAGSTAPAKRTRKKASASEVGS
jgi:transcription termination/antitermination protein NusA